MNNLIKQIVESKFNFNIDIEDNKIQDLLSKSVNISKSLKQAYIEVDLGLPSGTSWCKYNLDVDPNLLSKPKDWYGNYYKWGELEGCKTDEDGEIDFSWSNYKFGKCYYELTKYCNNPNYGLNGFTDNLTLLLPEDDIAYLNLHIENLKFRIPSNDLFEELIENTTRIWVENYNDINGLNGKIFKSKINDNEMFIPAAGYCKGLVFYDAGDEANLWSSSLDTDYPNLAWNFYFGSNLTRIHHINRYCGLTIRPVLLKS